MVKRGLVRAGGERRRGRGRRGYKPVIIKAELLKPASY